MTALCSVYIMACITLFVLQYVSAGCCSFSACPRYCLSVTLCVPQLPAGEEVLQCLQWLLCGTPAVLSAWLVHT